VNVLELIAQLQTFDLSADVVVLVHNGEVFKTIEPREQVTRGDAGEARLHIDLYRPSRDARRLRLVKP
jgi:hypothetical protein